MDRFNDPNSLVLIKQGYHLVGQGAVKACLWLNRSLRGGDQCYKHHFYGISSYRCVQMTPTLHCNHLCLHCWRPIDNPIPIRGHLEPKELLDGILQEQQKILSGYGGSETTDMKRLEEAHRPRHVAISLMGEPTLYPHLQELVDEIGKRGLTSFLVTNGTKPDVLRDLHPSQLYLSLNAPTRDVYVHVSNPRSDQWENIMESLEVLKEHTSRTVIRITLARGLNIIDPLIYARLLEKAEPDFVEIKAYMHLGKSRKRLHRDSMPSHQEIIAFAADLALAIGYELSSQIPISRVALLSSGSKPRILSS
ncbi:MAG: 4-demethylwyosine synthase TYW1 [Methanotrichaceae archaeon]|nr:4-demethylwyosine synthase TYW1 [Methanotrichaceae archaeon]